MSKLATPANIFFILVSLNVHIQQVFACSEHMIADKIFANYDPDIRPVRNQSTPIIIKLRLFIESIVDINEQQQSISLLVWMESVWTDEFLRWNISESDEGCSSIKTRAKKVWFPDAVFTNTLSITPIVTADKQWLSITNEGLVSMTVISYVTLQCTLRITDFPFDTQSCELPVTVWTYEYKELQLTLAYPPPNIATDIASNSSEFATISLDVVPYLTYDENLTFSELHYTLVLKRIPEYYIFVMIIPSFLLTSVCIIGIFTPDHNFGERNERVTLGLTTLLSMAVILNICADQVPKSSEGLPLLAHFVLYEIAMCTLAIILSTIFISFHQRALTRRWNVPRVLVWLASPNPVKNNAIGHAQTKKDIEKEEAIYLRLNNLKNNHEHINFDSARQLLTLTKETCERLQLIGGTIERKIEAMEHREIVERQWIKLFDRVDFVLLVVLLIANSAITFFLFSTHA